MVIILKAYVTTDGKYLMMPPKTVKKWPNDHDFGFNIGVPALWYFYLKEMIIGGKPLPAKTTKGTSVAYRVHYWGGIPGGVGKSASSGMTLFPSFTNEGTKLKIAEYGRLDINDEFWSDQMEQEKQ